MNKRSESARMDGAGLEQRVARHFSSQGWKIEIGKQVRGLEIGIYGIQNNLLEGPSYLIVECKDNDQVTKADLLHLVRKVMNFREVMRAAIGPTPRVRAVLAYTGNIIDEDVRKASRSLEPQIRLMRFRI